MTDKTGRVRCHRRLGGLLNFYERRRDRRVGRELEHYGHCSDGEGPNAFDKVADLERWVGHGKAPAELIASHLTDRKADRTRPLCSYPQVAKYQGTSSIDDAASFAGVAPSR